MRTLSDFYGRHFLHAEALFALCVSGGICWWLHASSGIVAFETVIRGNRAAVYGTLASLFGALLGFAITAVSIVFALWSAPTMALVRKSPHAPSVGAISRATVRWLAAATVISLVLLVYDRDGAQKPWLLMAAAVVFSFTVARVARCLWLLEHVLTLVTGKQRRQAEVPPANAQV